jgi:hypothetical protein
LESPAAFRDSSRKVSRPGFLPLIPLYQEKSLFISGIFSRFPLCISMITVLPFCEAGKRLFVAGKGDFLPDPALLHG